ncbi:unnamed protein product, partial [Ectocarpus sp. 12 AP-2014]
AGAGGGGEDHAGLVRRSSERQRQKPEAGQGAPTADRGRSACLHRPLVLRRVRGAVHLQGRGKRIQAQHQAIYAPAEGGARG